MTDAHSRHSRARLAALLASGLGLPLAALVLALLLTGGGEDAQACAEERLSSAPAEAMVDATGPDPLPWRLYAQPVQEARLRHNHLHGGVVVQYGNRLPAGEIARLADWYADDPVGIVVAPRPELGDRIRATAWAGRLDCDRFDEQAFADFRAAHRYKGPERIPSTELRPIAAATIAPQPVRGRTTIAFELPAASGVEVEIRARSGTVVRQLGSFTGRAGRRITLAWDGRDGRGRALAPGRYEVVLRVAGVAASSTRFRVG
ncbi:MAG: DUF3105 domain-containing protein [Actinobacteria bacterium]|nr:DUF3105 domain-containing protein [Actinomycetota bacterium]